MMFTATLTATSVYKSMLNHSKTLSRMVPGAGVEPARYFYRGILSSTRIPKWLILLASATHKTPSLTQVTANQYRHPFGEGYTLVVPKTLEKNLENER